MLTKTFKGGVILSEHKESTAGKAIESIPAPSRIILPLRQHAGSPNDPLVKAGDIVKVGQCVGESNAFISASVHSSVSGVVKEIRDFVNPIYGRTAALVIENDGKDEWFGEKRRNESPDDFKKSKFSKTELIKIIKDKGVVGLGGAAFPTHAKLNVPKDKIVDTLVANGAECEPYLTADYRLMVEKIDGIISGINIASDILGVKSVFLAIEENKPDAVSIAQNSVNRINKKTRVPIQIAVLKTKYPQGGEKQLIKAILKREVPAGKLPMDVGVMVQNVGTCFAIYEAVYKGKPLIERCVTITGSPIAKTGNFTIRLGTTLADVIKYCGGLIKTPEKIIIGGPMMGIAQYDMEIPIIKGVTGVIFLSKDEVKRPMETVCIRCGKCIEACPMLLMPTTLMNYVKKEFFAKAKDLGIANCFECGACAYVCPAKIPLLDYMKFGKTKVTGLL